MKIITKTIFNKKFIKYIEFIFILSLVLLTILIAFPFFWENIKNELEPLYNYDSNCYFGIGRALASGHKLYVDMFDIKPPGIYYMSALSFMLTKDFHLTNSMLSIIRCLMHSFI